MFSGGTLALFGVVFIFFGVVFTLFGVVFSAAFSSAFSAPVAAFASLFLVFSPFFFGLGRLHAFGQFGARNLQVEDALNLAQGEEVALADEGDGAAFTACTGGASDAVNVVLGIVGCIVVDDHGDVVDVDAARHDVGGHEQIHLSCAEELHHLVALGLFQVGVHGAGVPSFALQHNA